jgi:hypothetical protein
MAPRIIPDFEEIVEDLGIPGAGIAAIVLLPIIVPMAKPLAKTLVKGGIVLYEKGKGVIAEVGEAFEDIVAEAKAELAEAKHVELEAAEAQVEAS